MHKVLIIYNIIFLFIGNVLFSHIHHLEAHGHAKDETHDCLECIKIDNSNNFISSIVEIRLLDYVAINIVDESSDYIKSLENKRLYPRAPPILK